METYQIEVTICALCGEEIDLGTMCSYQCTQDGLYLDERKPLPRVRKIKRTQEVLSEREWTA